MDTNTYPHKIKWLLKIPVYLLALFFGLGTLLLLLFLVTHEMNIAVAGYVYLIASVILNLLALIVLIFYSFSYREYQKILLARAALLLINIPIAAIYTVIAINLILNNGSIL